MDLNIVQLGVLLDRPLHIGIYRVEIEGSAGRVHRFPFEIESNEVGPPVDLHLDLAWDALFWNRDLTLAALQVPEVESAEVLGFIRSTHDEIVE